jgi:ATP-dependent Clp protease ATP-binding subunit ClpC
VFERFTDRARRVLTLANEEASLLRTETIGNESMLLGLIHEGEGIAAKALKTMGIELERARISTLAEMGGYGPIVERVGRRAFTPNVTRLLELSLREALKLGHSYIGTEHMLLALLRDEDTVAVKVLKNLGGDVLDIEKAVLAIMSGKSARTERIADALGASSVTPIHPLTVYQLRQEISRLRDHITRMKMALMVMADGDMPHELALRNALEALVNGDDDRAANRAAQP